MQMKKMPSLAGIIKAIRTYPGLTRKAPIREVVEALSITPNAYMGLDIIADFGDDAAAVRLPEPVAGKITADKDRDGGLVYLLAADGIMQSLIDHDPYWAGYCSVLVNVNDIAAMGGLPIGMVNVISARNGKVLAKMIQGMREGCEKFGVPMLGGHTHPDADHDSIAVSIFGVAHEGSVICSHTARPGDAILFVFDLEGMITPGIPYSWDNTSMRTPREVQSRIKAMNALGERDLVNSGKDISNPGMLGTLGMLLETSNVGGIIDLAKIPYPPRFEFIHWLTVYHGCGFVLTAPSENVGKITRLLGKHGITVAPCGEVTRKRQLVLGHPSGGTGVLFDLSKDVISGARPSFLTRRKPAARAKRNSN